MKNIVIASDSFKGTLSSLEICELFKEAIKDKDIHATYIPIADGGEGSLDAISRIRKGKYINIKVKDLYFNDINTRFYIDYWNDAFIETASCAGMALAKKDNDPGKTTTYGVGEQIKKAIELGCRTIYVFLGGSATNDGGVGLAAALGTKFYNKNDETFIPTGLTLKDIVRIDNVETIKLTQNTTIYALTDVNSLFYGKDGAAYMYAPQKGATEEEVKLLDEGLEHLSVLFYKKLYRDTSNIRGLGAAGGLGGGLYAFVHAHLHSGIEMMLRMTDFNTIISNADLVISGEGKLDEQTFKGKVIHGVAKRCMNLNKPLDLIVGISTIDEERIKQTYPCIRNIYETNSKHLPFDVIKNNSKEDYIKQITNLLNNL